MLNDPSAGIEKTLVSKFLNKIVLKRMDSNIKVKSFQIEKNFKILSESFKKRKKIKNEKFAEIIRDENWLNWRLNECPYKKFGYQRENLKSLY